MEITKWPKLNVVTDEIIDKQIRHESLRISGFYNMKHVFLVLDVQQARQVTWQPFVANWQQTSQQSSISLWCTYGLIASTTYNFKA